MRRHRARMVAGVALLLALVPGAASADQSTITQFEGAGFVRYFANWSFTSPTDCITGRYSAPAEFRFALEFPLAALPTGAVIQQAALTIRPLAYPPAQVRVTGYAGDGVAVPVDDAPVTGLSVLYTPSSRRSTSPP